MPERAGKFTVLEVKEQDGPLKTLWVSGPGGEGRLYWFEVHDPESRSAFFRYRNALKRLERLDALPPGLEISTKPGRYYVYWPEPPEVTPPRGRRPRRRLAEIEASLKPLGYRLDQARLSAEGNRVLVWDLDPRPKAPPAREEQARPQGKRAPALAGVFLAIFGLLLAYLGVNNYLNPPVIELPDLTGKTVTEAQKALAKSGLVLSFVPESRPDEPPGVVLAQDPPPGTRLKPGRRVKLVYNRPELRQVPALVGLTLAEAEAELERLGYQAAPPARAFDQSPPDTVIAQNPPPGTPLAAGEEVRLVVSLGPRPRLTLVPDLEGTSPEEAAELLDLAGLRLGEENRVPSPEEENTLLAQSPRAGTVIEEGAPVVVSRADRPEVLLPHSLAAPAEEPAPPPPEAEPALPETPLAPGTYTVPLDLRLPPEVEGKGVRLTVTDADGTRVLYEGPTQKGWRLTGEVRVRGKATFRLYVGDYLYQEWDVSP